MGTSGTFAHASSPSHQDRLTMFRKRFLFAAATTLLVVTTGMAGEPMAGEPMAGEPMAGENTVDFNRDIRVILSDKCFLCHGPDESTREAGLRLDIRDEAVDGGAIVPGDAEASEMIARMLSDDPDTVMPPPEMNKPITDAERETIRQWIAEGAAYDSHWAFVPPRLPELPEIENEDWPRNAIDNFVLKRMESKGLSPSQAADAVTIARRMALDLTGLPPTAKSLDGIETAADPEAALQAWSENLIASKHFGERWARWWLDAARYADSSGYEKDMPRQTFFYRDWVINAMNKDLPYDDFVVHQIAGDLVPGAGQDERVATGFLRQSMTNEEGGADAEQFRVEGMFDRVDAIGKAILGLTTQCAQCHTHKYDPISHHEYYSMFAALNDIHEASISVFTPEQAGIADEVRFLASDLSEDLRSEIDGWKRDVVAWADSLRPTMPTWQTMTPTDIPFEGQKFRVLDDGSIVSESYAPTKASNPFSLTTHVGTITAVRVDALTHPQLPRGGPGRSIDGTAALTEFNLTVQPIGNDAKPFDVKFVRAIADINPARRDLKPQYRDRDPAKDERVVGPAEYAIDGDEKTAWTTDIGPGRSNQSRHIVFIPESPITIDGDATLTFTMVQKHGGWNSDDNQNFLVGRYRFSITGDDIAAFEAADGFGVESSFEDTLAKPTTDWSGTEFADAFDQYRRLPAQLASTDHSFAETNERIEAAWKSFPETASQLVAQALAKPRETFVLSRGDFLSPTDRVQADVPQVFNPMPADGSPDRLRFARWMVCDDSPTTARVVVNRIWQAYFGRGLVSSPEDFGFQSSPPSHPQLLDFLARELMDNDWSLKHIHRLIVDSQTYRQSSIAEPAAWAEDPDNTWLTRGPRFRMEAEMVRDLTLAASGLLNETIGGPSVYPPAPDFLFEPPTSYGPKIWDTDQTGNQYRRSLYVHQYRSVPYPPLQVFDAPKGDAACVRRERSNTPMQALVMMNEPQFVQAARALAARTLRNADDDTTRVTWAFRTCTGRTPDLLEGELLADLLIQTRARLEETSPADIAEMIGVSFDACLQLTGVDAPELAAWMTVCRAILNLDETISKS